MNHTPNTTDWQIGDLVMHDEDMKNESMLMQVVGTNDDGRIRTKYVDKNIALSTFTNDKKSLHDPARFGIDCDCVHARIWLDAVTKTNLEQHKAIEDHRCIVANYKGHIEYLRSRIDKLESDNAALRHDMTGLRNGFNAARDIIRAQQNHIDNYIRDIAKLSGYKYEQDTTIQSLRNDLDEMVRTHTIPSDEWMAKMFSMGE